MKKITITILVSIFLFIGCKPVNKIQKPYLTLKAISNYTPDYVIYRFGKFPNVIRIADSAGVYNFSDTIYLNSLRSIKR